MSLLTLALWSGACGDGDERRAVQEWHAFGGDDGATRYSVAVQITRDNVRRLRRAWQMRVGEAPSGAAAESSRGSQGSERASGARRQRSDIRFETTPAYRWGRLFVRTPTSRVLALQPSSGRVHWTFDPKVDHGRPYAEGLTSRGVALWEDDASGASRACSRRVFVASVDARLFAIDAESGKPCAGFGVGGQLNTTAAGNADSGATGIASITSPPTVIGDLVVVGATYRRGSPAVERMVESVNAFDARTGSRRWVFSALPTDRRHPAAKAWLPNVPPKDGGGNVWSIITADPERDLLFLPVASAAPQFVGTTRAGSNEYANSVVALRASTGAVVWSYQFIHHDLWDYDIAAPPMLVTLRDRGREIPAVVVGTKTGMIFVLDRRTGVPLVPIDEEPVPPSEIAGERTWPTQPFAKAPFRLHSLLLKPDSAFGITDSERAYCRGEFERLNNRGLFTPPSTRETLVWPGFWGGINWDGMAWDPDRQVVIVAMKRLAMTVQLIDRSAAQQLAGRSDMGEEFFPQGRTGFLARRRPLISPSGVPCSPPPWSELVTLRLSPSAEELWRVPLGRVPWLQGSKGASAWGSLTFGGPLVTAGGLVFIAGGQDDVLRAFDTEHGTPLWETKLSAGGQASPMTYIHNGRQYVVIAAGGRGGIGTPGDWVVAYALDP